MKSKNVTPSILNVPVEERLNMVINLLNEGIKWVHYDVMDGVFVSNTAIEFHEIKNINDNAPKHFKDIHLMVEDPFEIIELYKEVGDILTFHYEAVKNKEEILNFLIKNQHNLNLGMAIKPKTSVDEIINYLPYLRLVLVMSVEPGAGGQKFIETSIDKIKKLKEYKLKKELNYLIQVDGGINNITGPACFKAGADACVAGTFLIKEPTKERINSILNGDK
ncbi:ribulose-phosphate 3-epimerase [Mycoplasmopsis meleagridis]|uniref:ribulose-phosphate 3-epimerase n=1 Tax=Mycoplasmopsis meleagridis TaxID=29561 RepID=UPI00073D5D60|nr:ribulose-phosphate 3-epimerase [Mycoplasmopsis meleagridis]KUH47617.1 ribulose phosphate epimerase [Mycoplasmopsis meleagridis]